jgi:quercetin dioxygenase-like cupin family protein
VTAVAERFTVKHWDEFERSGRWSLVRRSLGVGSFGMNLVEIEPEDRLPEHDETERGQEEVFIVLEGDALFVIGGEEHPGPAGTFTRLDPEPSRTIVNKGRTKARIVIVSAPVASGYAPPDWA